MLLLTFAAGPAALFSPFKTVIGVTVMVSIGVVLLIVRQYSKLEKKRSQ